MEPILKSEWFDWKNSKVTKLFMQALYEKREGYKEGVVDGKFEKTDIDRVIGYCQGLGDTLKTWIENEVELVEDDEDAETARVQSTD